MASLWSAMQTGYRAFREAYLNSDALPGQNQLDWSHPDGRALRYSVLWAYFENTAYRDLVHRWAPSMRAAYGLYAHTRNIYNPAHRLIEFWVSHLLGGPLDPMAGGDAGAIPIELGDGVQTRQGKALRAAIARLWRDSNWAVRKDVYTRWGTCLGDVGIKIVDDVTKGQVRLQVVHPGTVRQLACDASGFVKHYAIEEQRSDPRMRPAGPPNGGGADTPPPLVTYREVASRDGDLVVYQTYLNGSPYPWNDVAAEWAEPYGFIPLVMTKHIDVGLEWGWSELHSALSKIREVDDLASKLDDQIRKTVDSPWLFAGVKQPDATPRPARTGADGAPLPPTTNRETGRSEVPILYASDAQARAQPLVAPLDIPGTLEAIQALLRDIERDYPELALDVIATTSGDASGRALRVAREPVENKTLTRRVPYESGLVRAQQMAIAIGGFRGYEGYQDFGLDSYAAGALDHRVAPRPVFAVDPVDELATKQSFWLVAGLAEKAGMPIEMYLEDAGWDQERIDRVTAARAERQAQVQQLASEQQPPTTQG